MAAKLPWWVSLMIAAISYALLHSVAILDVGMATSTKEIGTVAARSLYQSLANLGQYIVPLIFVVGAIVGALGQHR